MYDKFRSSIVIVCKYYFPIFFIYLGNACRRVIYDNCIGGLLDNNGSIHYTILNYNRCIDISIIRRVTIDLLISLTYSLTCYYIGNNTNIEISLAFGEIHTRCSNAIIP